MTDERWDNLIARLMDRFKDARFQKFTEQNEHGVEEKHEVLMFQANGQKFELERVKRPRIEERKVTYARRRAGSQETVIYSQTDFINFVRLYRLDGDTWNEIDLNAIEPD